MTPVWLDPVQTVGCEVKPDPAACCDLLTACWMEADSPAPKAEPIAFPAGQVNDTVTSTSTPLATSFADTMCIELSSARTVSGVINAAAIPTPSASRRIRALPLDMIASSAWQPAPGAV